MWYLNIWGNRYFGTRFAGLESSRECFIVFYLGVFEELYFGGRTDFDWLLEERCECIQYYFTQIHVERILKERQLFSHRILHIEFVLFVSHFLQWPHPLIRVEGFLLKECIMFRYLQHLQLDLRSRIKHTTWVLVALSSTVTCEHISQIASLGFLLNFSNNQMLSKNLPLGICGFPHLMGWSFEDSECLHSSRCASWGYLPPLWLAEVHYPLLGWSIFFALGRGSVQKMKHRLVSVGCRMFCGRIRWYDWGGLDVD